MGTRSKKKFHARRQPSSKKSHPHNKSTVQDFSVTRDEVDGMTLAYYEQLYTDECLVSQERFIQRIERDLGTKYSDFEDQKRALFDLWMKYNFISDEEYSTSPELFVYGLDATKAQKALTRLLGRWNVQKEKWEAELYHLYSS